LKVAVVHVSHVVHESRPQVYELHHPAHWADAAAMEARRSTSFIIED
jgi:hypothetical protein